MQTQTLGADLFAWLLLHAHWLYWLVALTLLLSAIGLTNQSIRVHRRRRSLKSYRSP